MSLNYTLWCQISAQLVHTVFLRVKTTKNMPKIVILTKFCTLGAPVPTFLDQSEPNLACKNRPTVYAYLPNFIQISLLRCPAVCEVQVQPDSACSPAPSPWSPAVTMVTCPVTTVTCCHQVDLLSPCHADWLQNICSSKIFWYQMYSFAAMGAEYLRKMHPMIKPP